MHLIHPTSPSSPSPSSPSPAHSPPITIVCFFSWCPILLSFFSRVSVPFLQSHDASLQDTQSSSTSSCDAQSCSLSSIASLSPFFGHLTKQQSYQTTWWRWECCDGRFVDFGFDFCFWLWFLFLVMILVLIFDFGF